MVGGENRYDASCATTNAFPGKCKGALESPCLGVLNGPKNVGYDAVVMSQEMRKCGEC